MSSAGNIIYKVDLSRNAGHYLERLDRPTQSRIVSALRNLAIDPYAEAVDLIPRLPLLQVGVPLSCFGGG